MTTRTHELEVERNQIAQDLEKQREAFEQHLSALRERGNFVNMSNSVDGMVNGEVDVESGDNMNMNDTVLRLEYDQLELNFSQLQVCKGNVLLVFWFFWLSVSLGAILSADNCLDIYMCFSLFSVCLCLCLFVCLSIYLFVIYYYKLYDNLN